jgi:hypothetical protein
MLRIGNTRVFFYCKVFVIIVKQEALVRRWDIVGVPPGGINKR